MNIAILGYGTVGSGVAKILETNADVVSRNAGEQVRVKYILDIRDFEGDPRQDLVVHDYNIILNDPEVETVVETMGGEEPAFTFVRQALEAGKSACTSNKVLVAAHGAQLLKTAGEHNVNFFFEASVGGGIPVLRTLCASVTADNILEISGILNGTTNYMLTKMKREGASYEDVLKQAQDNGFAERDPSADVEGYDACRKIAILTSLARGRQVDFEDIPTDGITAISEKDFAYAAALGGDIKLLGMSRMSGNTTAALVAPMIVWQDDPLYAVNDVFNAVAIKGDMLDDIMFYGKGAGSLPTASAVVSDVIQTVRNRGRNIPVRWDENKLVLEDPANYESRFLVRISGNSEDKKQDVLKVFPGAELMTPDGVKGEFGVVTKLMKTGEVQAACEGIDGYISRIYIKD